jgi:tetratricopeptide (TPR) repeat protein
LKTKKTYENQLKKENMGLFSNLFGQKKITFEEGNQAHDKAYAMAPPQDDQGAMIKHASKLMLSKKYAESIETYQKLAEQFPREKGLYESQIGVGYYFLGEYEKAIEYYALAMGNGQDKSMMDDNIWEATEALYKQTKDASCFKKYKQILPYGNYVKKAEKFL